MGSGDSKLQFRSRISELLKIRVTANNHDFWEVLFTTPLSLHDIFSLVSPTDVRELRKKQPGNLCTVVFKVFKNEYQFIYIFCSALNNCFSLHNHKTSLLNIQVQEIV